MYFWQDWLIEIAAEEAESDQQAAASRHWLAEEIEDTNEEWNEILTHTEAPDAEYHLSAFELGIDYAQRMREQFPPQQPMDEWRSRLGAGVVTVLP